MPTDQAIQHAAYLLLKQCGDDALPYATEWGNLLRAKGDTAGAKIWARVAGAVILIDAGNRDLRVARQ